MTQTTMDDAEQQAWEAEQRQLAAQPRCKTCGQPISGNGKSGLCQRCWSHQSAYNTRRSPKARKPTAAMQMFGHAERPLADTKPLVVDACAHHWLVEAPKGDVSHARCKLCGRERDFINEVTVEAISLRGYGSHLLDPLPNNE